MALADEDWEFAEKTIFYRLVCIGLMVVCMPGLIYLNLLCILLFVVAGGLLTRFLIFHKRLVYAAKTRTLTLYVGRTVDRILDRFGTLAEIHCYRGSGKTKLLFSRDEVWLPLGIQKELSRLYPILCELSGRSVKIEWIDDRGSE